MRFVKLFGKKILVGFGVVLLCSGGQAQASPWLDIYRMQLEQLSATSALSSSQVAANAEGQLRNLYDLTDHELGFDVSNRFMLQQTVDAIYLHPVFKSRAGLASALNNVSVAAQTASEIDSIITSAPKFADIKKLAESAKALVTGAENIGHLANRIKIFNNLIQYGSGNRNAYYQFKRDLDILRGVAEARGLVKELDNFIKTIDELGAASTDAYRHTQALIALLKAGLASEQQNYISQGLWAKLVIQDYIVHLWLAEGKIQSLSQIAAMTAYAKSTRPCELVPWSDCPDLTITEAGVMFPAPNVDSFVRYSFELETQRVTDEPNMFQVRIPAHLLSEMTGNASQIRFTLDGQPLLPAYGGYLTQMQYLAGTQQLTGFVMNLKPFKRGFNLEVEITSTNRSELAADYLTYTPQVTSVEMVDIPESISTENADTFFKVCGDPVEMGQLQVKNPWTARWGSMNVRMKEVAAMADNCRKYRAEVDRSQLAGLVQSNSNILQRLDLYGVVSQAQQLYFRNSDDSDGDGMPDAWELKFFSNLAQNWNQDPDQDGAINFQEWQANTDPTKAGIDGILNQVRIYSDKFRSCFISSSYWAHVSVECPLQLTQDVTINGDLTLHHNLDLNGFQLKVMGKLVHANGLLHINGGKLEVRRDYRQQDRLSDGSFGMSWGILKMVNPQDKMQVNGDFYAGSLHSHQGQLTAGILELKGNFSQLRTSAMIVPDIALHPAIHIG